MMYINNTRLPLPISPRRLALPFLAAATLALSGCAATPPKTTFYTAPPHEPAALATVFSSSGTYLAAIDGMPVENARLDSSYPIRVAPSYRALTVSYAQDALLVTSEITAELKAGHSYVLKTEKAVASNAAQQSAPTGELYNIWVEDSSNSEILGAKHLAKLNTVPDVPDPVFNAATQDFIFRLVGVVLEVMVDAALQSNSTHSSGPILKAPQPVSASGSTPVKQPAAPATQAPKTSKSAPASGNSTGKLQRP